MKTILLSSLFFALSISTVVAQTGEDARLKTGGIGAAITNQESLPADANIGGSMQQPASKEQLVQPNTPAPNPDPRSMGNKWARWPDKVYKTTTNKVHRTD